MDYLYRTGLGQDHHAFDPDSKPGNLLLAGCSIPHSHTFSANSDGDVLFHALTNACSSLSGSPFLGTRADLLCQQGIRNSRIYLEEAWKELQIVHPGIQAVHLAVSIEAHSPKLAPYLPEITGVLRNFFELPAGSVGITATTGEGLTGMGRGEGLAVLAILTTREPAGESSPD